MARRLLSLSESDLREVRRAKWEEKKQTDLSLRTVDQVKPVDNAFKALKQER